MSRNFKLDVLMAKNWVLNRYIRTYTYYELACLNKLLTRTYLLQFCVHQPHSLEFNQVANTTYP